MKLRIDRRFFNRAFWVITAAVARFVVIRGGSNSSKSWSNYQALVLWLLQGKDNAIVFRKQGSTLRNSVYENLKLVAKQLKIDHLFEYYYSGDKREVVCKIGGNRIIMSGLDEPDKLKSIVGIKRVILEEADAFTIDDFKELVRRFRGVEGIQFFFIFNPVSEKHWLKEVLFDTPQYAERAEHHVFTIDDNRFATADDYAELEALKEIDEDQYRIYRWGEWGIIQAKNPYLMHLKRGLNARKVIDNEEEPVIFSFDFNVKNSVTVWQKWQDEDTEQWQVQCLREIRMGGTENTDLEAICRILAEDYGERQIYFSGDSSGNNQSALTKGNAEAFKIVHAYLEKHGCEFLEYNRLQSNPRRKKSRFVTNAITKELGSRFAIDESCTELWADIVAIPCNAEGDLDKKFCDENDMGHCFVAGTLIETAAGLTPIEEIRIGDRVLTRRGFRAVKRSGLTRRSAVVRDYRIAGRILTCTDDHQIYTQNRGFVEAKNLNTNDIFLCSQKFNRLMDTNLSGTQILNGEATQFTFVDGLGRPVTGSKNTFTGMFGNWLMVQYQKGATFITKMKTLRTTNFPTLNAKRAFSTCVGIGSPIMTTENRLLSRMSKRLSELLLLGTNRKSALNGIAKMLRPQSISFQGSNARAMFVERDSRGISIPGFAQTIANQHFADDQELIEFNVNVPNAERISVKTDIARCIPAQSLAVPGSERQADVYDLTVQGKHEFFANGILVHNCLDTLRYFVWVFCFDIWLDVKKNIAVPKEFQIDDNNAKNNAY